ncbi:hypothetical protein AB0J38_26070 [Streptomyces sp. NPDC050095]|uniref:hypothetical protein n=1 Tax=unclassified Streptomyces TaxID=2593676 RepID=UPI0034270EE5
MSPLRTLRQIIAPTGRHRAAPETPRDSLLDDGQFEQLLEDGEIEANDLAHCPVERRTTFHAMHTDGSRTCWTCASTTGE